MVTRTTIPAYTGNYTKGRAKPIRIIVLHTAETGEGTTPAEGVGRWFQNPAAKASSHTGVDTDSICRYVADTDTAWCAPGANSDGLHVEITGRASQTTAQWADAASEATLRNAAIQVAEWCVKHKIPARYMTDAQLAGGSYRGITTHRQCTRALKRGTHTDPGPNFPYTHFLSLVKTQIARITGVAPFVAGPTLSQGATGTYVKRLQAGLNKLINARLVVDGKFGPATLAAVKKYQKAKGLAVDGKVGPATQKRLYRDGVRIY